MSNPSDDGSVREVKRLLRRLEMASSQGHDETDAQAREAAVSDKPDGSGRELATVPVQRAGRTSSTREVPTFGAVSMLVANAIMATATVTSLAWYLIYSSAVDRRPGGVAAVAPGSGPVSPSAIHPVAQPHVGNDSNLPKETPAEVRNSSPHAHRPRDSSREVLSGKPMDASVASDHASSAATVVMPTATGIEIPSRASGSDRSEPQIASPSAPSVDGKRPAPKLIVPSRLENNGAAVTILPMRLDPAAGILPGDMIVLTGLPPAITPARGEKLGDNGWSIPAASMGDLELRVPQGLSGRYELTLELRTPSGESLALSRLELVVATGLGTVDRSTAPGTAVIDQETQRRLVARGAELLSFGQVGSARALFERAARAGSAEAAIALGDTYDSKRLLQLQAPLNFADIVKATYWYERADELGSLDAKTRLIELSQNQ